MKARSLFFSLIFVLARSESWSADDQLCLGDNLISIGSIEISGNTKTNTDVIERELGLHPGDEVCESKIQVGINGLKGTGLFSTIDHSLSKSEQQTKSTLLKIKVSEKWTTIPILKVNSGGGVSQYTLGVYDPNILGKFLEGGAQYENLGGASSGVVWFKNPRLFGRRQGIDLQYWNIRRIRIKYDQEAENPEIKRGFLHEREKFYAEYFREVSYNLTARISFDYNNDTFSNKLLPESVLQKIGPNPTLPPPTELIISKIGFELGRIEGDPQSLHGQVFGAYFGYAHPFDGATDSFVQGDLTFNLFRVIAPRWQYGQRFLLGVTSTEVLQYWQYLGGLDRIRGFADNRFAGSHFALSNSEIRYLILQRSSLLIQGVGFGDVAAIGDETSAFWKAEAASTGLGIRLILPKFYRFIVRFDYAIPILKNDTMNWSFGVQQFF